MGKMLRRLILGAGAFLLCVALLAGPVGAAKKLVFMTTFPPLPIAPNTPLYIIKDSPTLYLVEGQLSSTRAGKRAGCHVRRQVRLHVLHPNNTDTVIASWKPKSISLFNFRVELVPSDSVYVSTPAKELVTRSGKRVRCASGRSVPQPVPQ
jgi:hypothetical protein